MRFKNNNGYSKKIIHGVKFINGRLHAVFYIYRNKERSSKAVKEEIFILKSGIATNENYREYQKRTKRNDPSGKDFLLWLDNYIDQTLTLDEARRIVNATDKLFKQAAEKAGLCYNSNNRNSSAGTEFYVATDENWLAEELHKLWITSYNIAYGYVMKRTPSPEPLLDPFIFRNMQEEVFITPSIEAHKNGHYIINWRSTGGTGKSKMSYYLSYMVCKDVELINGPWKTLVCGDTKTNTEQHAYEFTQFYRSITGKRLTRVYIIGSNEENFNIISSWAEVISKSNVKEVKRVIKDLYDSPNDCAIFVVKNSMRDFLQIVDSISCDFKKFYTIVDEVFRYVKEKGSPKLVSDSNCGIVDPKYKHLFKFKNNTCATMIDRGDCTDPNAIFNDDYDKFGKRVVDVDQRTARSYNWISDTQLIYYIADDIPEYRQARENKAKMRFTLGGNSLPKIAPHLFPVIEYIRKVGVNTKTKLLVGSHFIKDQNALFQVLTLMQSLNLIPADFKIINGKAGPKATQAVKDFNSADKAILLATSWCAVGQDTWSCDCFIPVYSPDSKAMAAQWDMRKDRWVEDKISSFVWCSTSESLEDSAFFFQIEQMADDKPIRIVSEAEFVTEIPEEVLGSSRNPREGTTIGNQVLIRDPRVEEIDCGDWIRFGEMMRKQEYSDSEGNSRFSEIFDIGWEYINNQDNVEFISNWLRPHHGKPAKEIVKIPGAVPCINKYGEESTKFGGGWHLSRAYALGIDLVKLLGFRERIDWDLEDCFKIMKKYSLLKDFRTQDYKAYAHIISHTDRKELYKHFNIKHKKSLNLEERLERAKTFSYYSEWVNEFPNDYVFIKRYKALDKLKIIFPEFIYGQLKRPHSDKIALMKTYTDFTIWHRENPGDYNYIRKNHNDLMNKHFNIVNEPKMTLSDAINTFNKADSYSNWRKNFPKEYSFIGGRQQLSIAKEYFNKINK